LDEFEAFCRHYHELRVEEVRKNHLYSRGEVDRLRAAFNVYDKDKSGTVEKLELAKVIGEYFPDATKSKAGQQDIQRVLAEVDGDASCCLDFDEFLILMRRCDDQRDTKDLELEAQVVKECHYTTEEVDGYRAIFLEHVDWIGEIGSDALAEILGKVVHLTLPQQDQLASLVRQTHPEGREVARFPQFLKLIKLATEEKSWRVGEQAARVVKRVKQIMNTNRMFSSFSKTDLGS